MRLCGAVVQWQVDPSRGALSHFLLGIQLLRLKLYLISGSGKSVIGEVGPMALTERCATWLALGLESTMACIVTRPST